ncbi:MAG: heptosyltransferase-3 [Alphaproteobacteria bacterium]|jgi:heptosyltransferase-3
MTQTNIGDVIISTVLLDRLLSTYPDAVVDVVAGGRSTDLFSAMPNLGELIPIVKKKHHMHYVDLWKKLVKYKYDIIVDLRGTGLSYFLRGKKKIRFTSKNKDMHKATQMANLWPMDKSLTQRVWVDDTTKQKIAQEVKDLNAEVLIGIGPTANWIGKTWPQRYFALVANKLIKMPGFENAKFVVFGAAHERKGVADFIDHLPENRRIDLVGKTSLTEAYAWMTHLTGFLGNDSGLSHLAAAADIPTVTLFGPTYEHLYAPVARRGHTIVAPARSVVNLESEAPKRLITDIKPHDVLHEITRLIETLRQEEIEIETEIEGQKSA